jgi:prephenate dehydratase
MREGALTATEEVTIRVEQQLIGCPGAVFDEIEAVESHPVALAQCRSFFAEHPQILMIESDDTAGSVAQIIAGGDSRRAAIASRRAAEIYGGVILRENVEDDPENYTRFVLLSRDWQRSRSNLTEPSADRGPRRGSPAGVVDAPDAGGGSGDLKTGGDATTLGNYRVSS